MLRGMPVGQNVGQIKTTYLEKRCKWLIFIGGGKGSRTPDLLTASQNITAFTHFTLILTHSLNVLKIS